MNHLLDFRVDVLNMNIIKNSLNFRETGDNNGRTQYRDRYMINAGYLYPNKHEALKKVATNAEFVTACKDTPYMRLIGETKLSVD